MTTGIRIEQHENIEAQSQDGEVQLIRISKPYGAPAYRVKVGRICDKRHATMESATTHFGKALTAHLRHLHNGM